MTIDLPRARTTIRAAGRLIALLLAVSGAASTAPAQANRSRANLASPYGRHTDDLDGMLKRRNIRALVIINPIGFFYNNGHPMGINYEALRDFQTFVNTKYKTGSLKVQVTYIPVRPDQVESALLDGTGDLIAYALVVTPERAQRVGIHRPAAK